MRRAAAGHRGRVLRRPPHPRAATRGALAAVATRRAPSCATCPADAERRPGDRQRSHLPGHDGAGHDAVLPRETRPSGEAEAGTLPALVVLGIYDRCTPKLASDASRAVAMLSSLAEAQAQLRSDGIALDIKTLRSTAYRYAARARAAQQSAACGLLDRVTGKRVVVSLDGGRVRVRRKKRGPKTKKGATDSIPTGRNRSSSSCTSSATTGDRLRRGPRSSTHAPGTGGGLALLLSYARRSASTPLTRCSIADGAPWIWQRIQRLIAALGLSPTQVLG